MCYLVRRQQAEAAGAAVPPSQAPQRLRPRLIAAVAAAVFGGLALAALTAAPPTPSLSSQQDAAPSAPLVTRAATVPTAGVVEVGSGPVDDGVPAAGTRDVANAGVGHCHHGL
ncbi:MAG: hypothetical protein JWQ13_363 [Ramlibacter sp.]|jgi:hypothetical protein|nr:hypothetical protein [Ramlibacter sp.]